MAEHLIRRIQWQSGAIIYNEDALRTTANYLIFPGVCVTRITKGSGKWQIGTELCPIKSGDMVFLSNLEPRRIVADSGDLAIAAFSFSAAFLTAAGAEECLRVYYGRTQYFTHAIQSPELSRIFNSVRSEMLSDEPSGSMMLAYAIELLIGAGRLYDRQYPNALDKNFRCDATAAGAIAASAAYINENLTADLRVDELARLAGMSAGYYTRLFRKYVSVTPVDYIARCRVKRFLSLMSEGKSNILDTAFECGFTSASGFYKAFHRICGHSPKENINTSMKIGDAAAGDIEQK